MKGDRPTSLIEDLVWFAIAAPLIVLTTIMLAGITGLIIDALDVPWPYVATGIACIIVVSWLLLSDDRVARRIRPWIGLHP